MRPATLLLSARLALSALVTTGLACGSSKPPEAAAPLKETGTPRDVPVVFSFDSLDERPVSSEAMRGKPTVIAFIAIGNLGSQAQANYLIAMSKKDGDATNYAAVALEPSSQRELFEMYRKTLGITFPIALSDAATLAGNGPFGELNSVPAVVILDKRGRIVFRADGRVVKSDELRERIPR